MSGNGRPIPVESATAFAERYFASGLQCIPIRSDGTKAPAISSWKPYQDPTKRCSLSEFGGRGVAVLCGAASGGVEVIDFDNPRFYPLWAELVEQSLPGLVQRLVIVQTPRQDSEGNRGIHVMYRCPNPDGNQVLAYAGPPGGPNAKPAVETRGEGGYVLTVGSPPACHPTGRTYELLAGDLCDIPMLTPDERDTLLNCARALSRWQKESSGGEQPAAVGASSPGEIPGDAFARVTSWEAILTPHGWARVGDDLWRRPGKTSGWSATTCCVSGSGNELFKVFTTDGAPFEHLATYTKFAAFAVLNHGGDFSAAARELKRSGFGSGGSPRVTSAAEAMPTECDPQSLPEHQPVTAPTVRRPVLPRIVDAADLVDAHPNLAQPLIHDVLRIGETMNIIAASKTYKSYLILDLLLSVVTGKPWLGVAGFPVTRGRVLLLDNELHEPTLAGRIAAVASAKGLVQSDYRGRFGVECLRGHTSDITAMDNYIESLQGTGITLLILDALYRFWPPNFSENDNAAATVIYNRIDSWAEKLGCGIVAVHHASKGMQAGKATTDVGAGAGAISRAADSHMVLRPHVKPNHVVLDLVTRSFPPTEPFSLAWEYPLWLRSAEKPVLDIGESRQKQQQRTDDSEAIDLLLRTIREAGGTPVTKGYLRNEMEYGSPKINRLVRIALDDGLIRKVDATVRGKTQKGYELTKGEPSP